MTVSFHPEAERVLVDGARFYEEMAQRLGLAFVSEVQRASVLITENPGLGQKLDPLFRRVLLRRFPYSVVYQAGESEIYVVAIAHQSRRPDYWNSRVRR